MAEQSHQDQVSKVFSGRFLVGSVFCFAALMTASLFIYWNFHVGPFLPLQKALDSEFEDCQPMVQGGQRKMHEDSPRILRVTMKVQFNPLEETDASKEFVETVTQFITSHWKLSDYDELHLHFYKNNPEKKLQENIFKKNVQEILSESKSS